MRAAPVRHLRWALAIGAAGLCAIAPAAPAAATKPASFKVVITPAYTTAGQLTTFRVTVTNTSSNGIALHDVQLTPPTGFKLAKPAPTAPLRRKTVVQSRTLTVHSITVSPRSAARLVVTATAPRRCGKSVLHWSSRGFEGATATGPQLALQPGTSQVAVTVLCPDVQACGDGGPPCSTNRGTEQSNYSVVDDATSGALHETVNVGKPLTCAGYRNRDPNWYDSLLTNVQPPPAGAAPFVDTVTYKILGAKASGIGFCLGAPYHFTTASGAQARPGKLPNGNPGFIGLLPMCAGGAPPCVSSLSQSYDASVKSKADTTLTVMIPERGGDPWGSG